MKTQKDFSFQNVACSELETNSLGKEKNWDELSINYIASFEIPELNINCRVDCIPLLYEIMIAINSLNIDDYIVIELGEGLYIDVIADGDDYWISLFSDGQKKETLQTMKKQKCDAKSFFSEFFDEVRSELKKIRYDILDIINKYSVEYYIDNERTL